ncbi:M43 family zinc metalloprotease [Spirosoma koreense]
MKSFFTLFYLPLLAWLMLLAGSCRPKEDVLPGVANVQLVLSQNKRPLPVYFLEDTAHDQVSFQVYFFDDKGFFVTPTVTPEFLVNGIPIQGNTYRFRQAGQFTFTAKIGNRSSDNQLTLTAGKAVDLIREFTLTTAVPFVNADSTSRLPLVYTLIDKQGNVLDSLDYAFPIQLTANGVAQQEHRYIKAGHEGPYTLQANLWGKQSNVLPVTARKPLSYDLVRFPVIIHIPKSANPSRIDPSRILAEVNRTFRARKPSADPNQADAYMEFVPATTDPDGRPLAVPGLDQLAFDNPPSVDTAVASVSRVVRRWCPQQYINVFLRVDWARIYGPDYSYSYIPRSLTGSPLTCEQTSHQTWQSYEIPAIFIVNEDSFPSLDHELGHFFGLMHTFDNGCTGPAAFPDVAQHKESHADGYGLKYTCSKIPFVSDYTMDYYVPHNSFTYQQIQPIRLTLNRLVYIPAGAIPRSGRQPADQPAQRERGTIMACPSQ